MTLGAARVGRSSITWEHNRRTILMVALVSRAANFSLVSIIARYLADRGVDPTTIGVVLAVSGIATAASQAWWARAIRSRGVAWTGSVAAALATAGCVLLGLSQTAGLLVVSDALISIGYTGLATATRTITASKVEGQADSESRFGRLSSAQTIGGFVGPLLLGALVVGSTWVAPWFAAALSAIVLLLWSVMAVRGRTLRVATTAGDVESPEDEVRGEHQDEGVAERKARARWVTWWDGQAHVRRIVWSLRLILLCTLGTAMLYGANVVLWGLYLMDIGADASLTSWSFAIFSAPMVFLAPRAGRLWRDFPRTKAIPLGSAALGGMALVYGSVSSVPLAVSLALVEGAFMAMTMPIMAAQVPLIVAEEDIPSGYALFGALDTVVSVVGTAAGGALITLLGVSQTWYVFGYFCIGCAVVALFVGGRIETQSTGRSGSGHA